LSARIIEDFLQKDLSFGSFLAKSDFFG